MVLLRGVAILAPVRRPSIVGLEVGALFAIGAIATLSRCAGVARPDNAAPSTETALARELDGASSGDLVTSDTASGGERRHVAIAASEVVPKCVRVLLHERGTGAALRSVPVRLFVAGDSISGNRVDDIALAEDGGFQLGAADLAAANWVGLGVSLPELAAANEQAVVLPRIEELRTRHEPLVVDVDRGRPRALRVVDAEGAPIAGAIVEMSGSKPVVTDARGAAQPVLEAPPSRTGHVVARGRKQLFVREPEGDGEWVVTLPLANRLEFVLADGTDRRGLHVELTLSAAFVSRQFHQSHYVQTPGRVVDGTPGLWSGPSRGPSAWSLGWPAEGPAVLDQLDEGGEVDVQLWSYGELLERRALVLPDAGGCERIVFAPLRRGPEQMLRILGPDGRPRRDVTIVAAVPSGAMIDTGLERGLPAWCSHVRTDAEGLATLPDAADDLLCVIHGDGLAMRVMSFAELRATAGLVRLDAGCAVRLIALDRDGEVMIEDACGAPAHVEPYVTLAHGVKLVAQPGAEPGEALFSGLPPATVAIGFTHLDEELRHDARTPNANFRSRLVTTDMGLGK